MAVDLGPELVQQATKKKKRKSEEEKTRVERGLVQITRLIQRKRQPRVKSGLPFTETRDLVASRHLLPVGCELDVVYAGSGIAQMYS